MSDDKILVDRIETRADGQIAISGVKSSTKENFMLVCSAYDYCGASLKNGNNLNKSNKFIDLFKLTDIPNTMIIKEWTNAAFINRKWLNERALEMTSEEKGDWGNSNPALDYYDSGRFNHEWLSKFKRYNEALIILKKSMINEKTKPIIIKKLTLAGAFKSSNFINTQVYESRSSYLDILTASDMKNLHNNWQVQRTQIDTTFYNQAETYSKNGIDDLWATFGGCAVYAGIGDYKISKFYGIEEYEIEIKSIICYVVDSYDFIVTKKDDDYLGHWNKTAFDFHLIHKVDKSNKIYAQTGMSLNSKIRLQEPIDYDKFLYPVFNHHYQAYRKRFGKGGDMVIWTKPHKIALTEVEGYKTTFNYDTNNKPKNFLEKLVY